MMKSDPMLSIQITFINGQFHATPWNKQVNEGFVEWPPSPWRLVRAIIYTWYHKVDDIPESTIKSLVEKLSVAPPSFLLPSATLGHTRHFMPLYKLDEKGMIFDTFAIVGKDPVYVIWQSINLVEEEKIALKKLLTSLGYLGRAESWIEAKVVEFPPNRTPNCYPLKGSSNDDIPEGYGKVRVLLPMNAENYTEWRKKVIENYKQKSKDEPEAKSVKKRKSANNNKLSKEDEESIEKKIPYNIFEALHIDTGEMKKDGWSKPPGSKWSYYIMPLDPFKANPITGVANQSKINHPTVARFAVASNVPPRLTDAISIADRIHTTLVKISKGMPTISGVDEKGVPLKGHKHVYILCESNMALGKGHRGEITHVTLYLKEGILDKEREVIDKLKKVWGYGGHDIQLVMVGIGTPKDFGGIEVNKGMSPILGKSKTWISSTPFVPTRHPKFTRSGIAKLDKENGLQIGSPEHDLYRLLKESGFPEPKKIQQINFTELAGRRTKWVEFRLERKNGGGLRSGNIGYGFKVEFEKEVEGPIAVGYGAHFGLGLFVPYVENHKQ